MSDTPTDYWKSKLAAFLHDPPSKPYRIAGHEDARESFWHEAHLTRDEFLRLFARIDDHLAAAADRMIFPDPRTSGVRTDWKADEDCAFHHPLGGGKLVPREFPRTADAAEDMITRSLQRAGLLAEDDPRTLFWKLWRRWPETAAREHDHFAYLVADTRVPHHSLWHHNGLVSALSGCGENCAFLLFQIGPVQDFIQHARSTRDLWAGSFLLSYLIARGMFALAKKIGPDSIVYPHLRGAPLFDWFGFEAEGQFWQDEMRARFKDKGVRVELLTPNLPNRFLAVVPSHGAGPDGQPLAALVEGAVRRAWEKIADIVRKAIQSRVGDSFKAWDQYWEEQVNRFPVCDHVLHPWAETSTILRDAEDGTPPLHGGWQEHPLRHAITWARERIDSAHYDSRCYKHRSWSEGDTWTTELLGENGAPLVPGDEPVIENQGFVWALHYAATDWRFAAAKSARATGAWSDLKEISDNRRHVEKDQLDGRDEVLGGHQHDAFWEAMRQTKWGEDDPSEGATLFKGQQEYGALTTIKRLFPHVWMKQTLDTQVPKFKSPIDVALDDENDQSTYYAVLAMDGDSMGQWVGGSRTPPWKEVLSGTEDDPKTPLGYFKKHWNDRWEKVRVPLTPSFHAALSEALGNFSLYCARQIVQKFEGRLIYAGGDDVLAMLPASEAVDCAVALQIVFRGIDPANAEAHAGRKVQEILRELFDFPAPGFIRCEKGTGEGEHTRPSWPLMVMGPKATASIGIAIGHVRSPMQDVIQAAREAEAAAKAVKDPEGHEKGALCLRVLKRSGEDTQCAARFDSGVWSVWDDLEEYRGQQSGRFIYRFLQKIKPLLATVRNGRLGWESEWKIPGQIDLDLRAVVAAELAHSLARQSDLSKADARAKAEHWLEGLAALDPENFIHFWMSRAFLNRSGTSGEEPNG